MVSATEMKCDSHPSNGLANSTKSAKRAKHMDIKNPFVKQVVESGHTTVSHVNPFDNKPEDFTKPLGSQQFMRF